MPFEWEKDEAPALPKNLARLFPDNAEGHAGDPRVTNAALRALLRNYRESAGKAGRTGRTPEAARQLFWSVANMQEALSRIDPKKVADSDAANTIKDLHKTLKETFGVIPAEDLHVARPFIDLKGDALPPLIADAVTDKLVGKTAAPEARAAAKVDAWSGIQDFIEKSRRPS
jgi:hypothetical protein